MQVCFFNALFLDSEKYGIGFVVCGLQLQIQLHLWRLEPIGFLLFSADHICMEVRRAGQGAHTNEFITLTTCSTSAVVWQKEIGRLKTVW